MVVFDNTFLTLLLHPKARPPLDPSTGRLVDRLDERIELLITTLDEDGETVIVPVPVLTEFLVLADKDGSRYLSHLDSNRLFRIEPFDQKAAVELAALHLDVRASGGGRRGDQEGTYAKIAFDRQIVAIAKVNGAHTIYSDDEGIKRFAERYGLSVVRTWELPLPQEKHPLFSNTLNEDNIVEESNGTDEGE